MKTANPINSVTVYASSSRALHNDYYDAANRLGKALAGAGKNIVYGGGDIGLMGALASSALAAGTEVHGIIPGFLAEIEAGKIGLTSLDIVNDMRERKHRLLNRGQAVVALPGGSGTLEELFEAITLKRLGQYLGAIVLVNTLGYFKHCVELLNQSIRENFMDERHSAMWAVVDHPEDAVEAMENAADWHADAREFAAVAVCK